MVFIRPVRNADLDQLVGLTGRSGFGLTSLPKDRDLLSKRIAQSQLSFQLRPAAPGGELYLFVMEDLDSGEVVGTSAIVSKVGGFEPFYAYSVQTCIHESKELGVHKGIRILRLVKQHSGPCEIGGLFLRPDYRKHGNGRLLSLFRFLFMAQYPQRFESLVIAEMRGVVTENGYSPFWEALGRHFFDMDFPQADHLSVKDKKFIADLMPDCPIYIPLLPKDAQDVIGKVHPHTEPALKMLRDEGFQFTGMVDIFEAGPIVSSGLNDLRIVRERRSALVGEIRAGEIESQMFIITNTHEDFRACTGTLAINQAGTACINARVAQALQVNPADTLIFSPIRSHGST